MMSFTMAPISHYAYIRTTPAPEVPREQKSEQKTQEPINTQKAKGTARERQKAIVGRARAKEAHPQMYLPQMFAMREPALIACSSARTSPPTSRGVLLLAKGVISVIGMTVQDHIGNDNTRD